jgi:DNA polymerase III epsilon subunit-like protein
MTTRKPAPQINPEPDLDFEDPKEPRIIVFDTESTELKASIGHLLCVGWKVLGQSKTTVIKISDYELFDEDPTDDYAVAAESERILSNADGWVGWYSKKHDIPFLQTRLMHHGLPPLPKMTAFTHIDCWRIARYQMRLNSNRLATVSAFLGLKEKTPLKWRTWERAAAGHLPSLRYVYKHCKQDVEITESVYEELKVLDLSHFNVALCVKGRGAPAHRHEACPTCGTVGRLQSRGWQLAKVRRMQRFQCMACGAWCKGPPQKVKGVEKR